MIQIQAKHVKTEKQQTQTKIVFSTVETINLLDEVCIEGAKGYLYFSPDKITQEAEMAMRDKRIGVDSNGQSSSKKLRAALYEVWHAKINDKSFEEYYESKINKLVEQAKASL